jgi:hypothetical protein
VQGDNEKTIVDKSINTASEATTRATAEYNVANATRYNYLFSVLDPERTFTTGDVIHISDDKTSTDTDVRIMSVKRVLTTDSEDLQLEVRATTERERAEDRLAAMQETKSYQDNANSMKQGAISYSVWGSGINGKTSYPFKVGFYVSSDMVNVDGTLKLTKLLVDYDIDVYKKGVGSATFTGSDPQVQNSSGNTQPNVTGNSDSTQPSVAGSSSNTEPGVAGTSGSTTPAAIAGVSVWGSFTVWYSLTNSYALAYAYENLVGSPAYYTTRCQCLLMNVTGGTVTVTPTSCLPPGGTITHVSNYNLANNTVMSWESGVSNSSNASGWFKFWDDNYHCSACRGQGENIYDHTHGSHTHSDGSYTAADHSHANGSYYAANHYHADGSYTADNHAHPDGSYDVNASDLNYISIGDGVSDGAAVNATSVNIYLDYWSGGVWVNKHSILATGQTLDYDVDISNGGLYPNALGYWRIRIDTNSASADYIQGKVKMKYALET